jgi:hypothetical protein
VGDRQCGLNFLWLALRLDLCAPRMRKLTGQSLPFQLFPILVSRVVWTRSLYDDESPLDRYRLSARYLYCLAFGSVSFPWKCEIDESMNCDRRARPPGLLGTWCPGTRFERRRHNHSCQHQERVHPRAPYREVPVRDLVVLHTLTTRPAPCILRTLFLATQTIKFD